MARMVNFMLHIFYYSLKQPEEEEEGEERKERRLLAQSIQAAVTTTETQQQKHLSGSWQVTNRLWGLWSLQVYKGVLFLCLYTREATRQLARPLSQHPDNIPTQQRLHSLISTGTSSAFGPGVCDLHTDPSLCVVRPPHWTGGLLSTNQTALQSRRKGTTMEKQNENRTRS